MVFSPTGFVLLFTFVASQSLAQSESLHTQQDKIGYRTSNRNERAVKFIGNGLMVAKQATEEILKTANRVATTKGFREYRKRGGYEQAVKDFRSVKPFDVQKNRGTSYGKYGDREIMIYKDWRGVATLEIRRRNHNKALKITKIRYPD